MSEDIKVKFCHVCSEPIDKFKGLHYGGQTCYSCRAFFRRCHSADRKTPFEANCKNDSKCEMSAKTRRKCPKCRHIKCLQIGMRAELVLTQDEKKARFRKYYEKKAMKRLTSREHTDSGGSSGSASGLDELNEKIKVEEDMADISDSNCSSVMTTKSNNNNNSKTEEIESNSQVVTNGEEVLMEVLANDNNLVQLCLDEVDKILRESTPVISSIPALSSTTSSSSSSTSTLTEMPAVRFTSNSFNNGFGLSNVMAGSAPSSYLTTLGQRAQVSVGMNNAVTLASSLPVNFGTPWGDAASSRFDTHMSEKYILERL